MPDYKTDRQWSDRFIPQVKQIVGPLLLEPAPLERDNQEATDLIVLCARDMRIAVRIRRPGYENYLNEFTIRCERSSGAKTELAKIVDGWGDWFFYGHAANAERLIHKWMLIDLAAFRAALIRVSMSGLAIKNGHKANGDGTVFRWFDAKSFPKNPPLIIASNHLLNTAEAAFA